MSAPGSGGRSGRGGSSGHRRPGPGRDRRRSRSRQAPRERVRSADPARRAAWDALRAVGQSGAYANLVLPPMLRERRISGRDAAFATELAYGTLRLRGRYDAVLDAVADRGVQSIDPPVLDALRLGVHQLLGMRVPDHAAVSATVGLAREAVGAGPAQFVNAVLRKVAAQDLDTWLAQIGATADDQTQRLAVTGSHPAWIVRAFRQALAETTAGAGDLPELVQANNSSPAVHLVLRPGLVQPEEVHSTEPGRWTPTAQVLTAGDPHAIPAVREARAGIQDEGSQLVTLVAAAAPVSGSDRTWLDLCAGPGGKAALFGALLAERDTSGELLANEVAEHRAQLVRSSTAAVQEKLPGLSVRTGDGREIGAELPGHFDRALVDVPCTGLGALRRRPEARWRRRTADLAELGVLQRELLTAALEAVRPGGVVSYITCSPHLAETRLVVEDVVRRTGAAEVLDAVGIAAEVTTAPLTDQQGPYLQLWPHRHGTDAMFCAVLRRTGA
ncbi:RsmB/NOP family class I SAM-dependent RNA methyltransferase [Ruania albidiflava]|uniref:RsmB/NOP family class I SAM-dependent RNA methyltransferase n=1 Tax=Ruania albidiflava TaxID=366586 RepID=UPI0003FEFC52|nr:transcription antitermination factor NusB [Ruania albidiflava]